MLLTGRAKAEAKVLFTFMSQEELTSLAHTVTNHQIDVRTFDDAVNAILTFSQSVEELLKRKKIKRDTLFRYLASHGIGIDPKGEKHTLVDEILKFWKEQEVAVRVNGSSTHQNSHKDGSSGKPPDTNLGNTDGSFQFAKQFAEWFYNMLNSCNPNYTGQNGDSFTTEHFYPDCGMKLLTKTSEIQQEDLFGAETVHLRLRSFPCNENLLFVPNLEVGGVVGKMNAHGLVLVHVCGTVHRPSEILGLFEQRFGLVKDPSMQLNWRVKFTNLCLQAGAAVGTPQLGMGLAQMLPNS